MIKPTVSKHWRKPVGRRDQAWIPPEPLHHVTIIQQWCLAVLWLSGSNTYANIIRLVNWDFMPMKSFNVLHKFGHSASFNKVYKAETYTIRQVHSMIWQLQYHTLLTIVYIPDYTTKQTQGRNVTTWRPGTYILKCNPKISFRHRPNLLSSQMTIWHSLLLYT